MTNIEQFRQAHLNNVREAAERLLADKYDHVYWDHEEDSRLVAQYALQCLNLAMPQSDEPG